MTSDAHLLVLDASVAVKWFVTRNEDSVEPAEGLLTAHAEHLVRLVGPSLLAYELMNVLRGRSHESADLVAAMGAFFDVGVLLVPPDRESMGFAARVCADRGIAAADATYAALAHILDCELVTADRRLAHTAEGVCRVRLI